MESEILMRLKDISLEALIISIIVFGLTMLIKWPIKQATSKLEEDKRKAVNTIIVFIPMILSFLISCLYFGLFTNQWFETIVFNTATSAYILAFFAYAFYSRVLTVYKGIKKTPNETQVAAEENYCNETIALIKQNIQTISQALKLDKNNLEQIVKEIENLLSVRNQLTNNSLFQDIAFAEKLETQLNDLEKQKQQLSKSISEKELEIENYQKSLNNKEDI